MFAAQTKTTKTLESWIRGAFEPPEFPTRQGKLRTFDRVVATAGYGSAVSNAKPLRRALLWEGNPIGNQDWCTEADHDAYAKDIIKVFRTPPNVAKVRTVIRSRFNQVAA